MDFNKRISKFLIRLTLASSFVSSMDCVQVFAMEDSSDFNIKQMAFANATDGLEESEAAILETQIAKYSYLYKWAANYFQSCYTSGQVSDNLENFFSTLDLIYQNPANQTTNTLDKVISVAKDVFKIGNQNNQNDKDDLQRRLKGYFAVILYCDARKCNHDIPKFVVNIIQKFDPNGDIQEQLLGV